MNKKEHIKQWIKNINGKVYRILQEKNLFVVHLLIGDNVGIYIFEYDKKIKLLDKVETKFLGKSPINGRTQIDGNTKITNLDKTEETKKIIEQFHKNFLFTKNKKNIRIYISSKKYLQHNLDNNIGDGIEELERSLKEMAKNNSFLTYDKLIYFITEGNFSFSMSKQNWFNKKINKMEFWYYFDIFRLENKKIVEHWDIIKKRNN